jgi:transposase InsO family protein
MARLALDRAHREAGDDRRVAPLRFSPVLDVEEPTPHRATGRATRRSCPDSGDVRHESAVGCASDPRRTSEAGNRDAVFAHVATIIASMNIQPVRTAPPSPWQNAHVERVIGSIRRECLDHVIVFSAVGVHRVLVDYVAYCLHSRTHLALGKDAPSPRSVAPPSAGHIVASPEVGGLHHRYGRVAA